MNLINRYKNEGKNEDPDKRWDWEIAQYAETCPHKRSAEKHHSDYKCA